MTASDMIVVFPGTPSPDLARTLDMGGYRWKAVSGADEASKIEPQNGWMGAIISCDEDAESAWAFARAVRKRDNPVNSVLLLISGAQLGDLELRDDLFDDFCLTPFHPRELEARLRHLFSSVDGGSRPELVEHSFTREMLLSRVWGYEYYGGARTVDVHVRRLRAKLGEEHANLIQTVRSVGYRFGQGRWGS